MSYRLQEIHFPKGWSLPGNKLSSSNREQLYGKLTGYNNVLDMPAQGHASIFPGKMEHWAEWHKQSTLVVISTFSKADHQVVAYAFLNFPDFVGI